MIANTILIIVVFTVRGLTSETIEFKSMDSCVEAKKKLSVSLKGGKFGEYGMIRMINMDCVKT